MAERILVVDDDLAFQGLLVDALTDRGWDVDTANSAEEGIDRVKSQPYDLVLHDVKLPGLSGIDALPEIREAAPGVDVIVMTGYASKDSGVKAMQRGAYDYFHKPFSLTEMEVVIRRALEKRKLQQQLETLKRQVDEGGPLAGIIGDSPAMKRVKDIIARVAGMDVNVLIIGETGTGKELISDTVHAMSQRAGGPFVKINCAAIPDNLLESELFGHEKGAFTGATSTKAGRFEQAGSGTILLDEIGDMPLHLQPKLLRAVENKQVERVGGNKPVTFDTRIIAATNQELEQRIRDKEFRSDLYYRLNVATILLPALRERKEDIPDLCEFFLERVNTRLGTAVHAFTSGAMKRMYAYDWPGNVRQLANAVERATIFCQGEAITPEDMDLAFSNTPQADVCEGTVTLDTELPLKEAVNEYERKLILNALERTGHKQTEAAKLLGISAKNLWNKLQKHGIS